MNYTPSLILLLVGVGAAMPVAVSEPGGGPRRGMGGGCAIAAAGPVALSEPARAALRFQIEEERMARELYLAWGGQWDLRPLRHILRAETRHETALRALAQRAGLVPPAVAPGQFSEPIVQQRYETLLARGRQSAAEALRAGAAVEAQDIANLQALRAGTDSAELRGLAAQLEAASQRHLQAFQRCGGRAGPRGAGRRGRGGV